MALFVRKFTFATRFCDVSIMCFRLFLPQSRFSLFRCTLCSLSDAAFSPSVRPCIASALSRHLSQQKTAQTALLNPSALFLCTV